jgi:hypothetical protein
VLHEHRHARAVGADEAARVLERRPDDVTHAAALGGRGHVLGLCELALGREVLPEVGDAEGAVRTVHRALDAGGVVEVGGAHLGAELRQRLRRRAAGTAGDGADAERAVR